MVAPLVQTDKEEVDMDFTLSEGLHFYFRRAKAFELSFGSTPFHLETLEAEIRL